MKKASSFSFVVIFILLIAVQSCSSSKDTANFTIRGNIKGDADGKMIYLSPAENPKHNLDSTSLENGRFEFTGRLDYPQLYNIVIAKNDTPLRRGYPLVQPVIPVFIENSNIDIFAVLDSIPDQNYVYYGGYNYNNVEIKGSRSQELYRQFLKGYQPLADFRMDLFMNKYIKYLNPPKDQEKGPVSEGIDIVTKIDEAALSRDNFVKSFIRDHNRDMVTLYIAKDKLSSFSVNEIDEILKSISPKLVNSEAGQNLIKHAKKVKKTASGAMYVDFSFNDDKGNSVKLSDYLGKGKYVLLEFWASWCGPCRADIPHLRTVYDLYNPEGFEVISISMDDDKSKWLEAIEDEKMKWLQVSDLKAFDGLLSKIYNFNGIPTCLLIDPQGKIVTRNMRGSWMDKKLIELYGNKFSEKF